MPEIGEIKKGKEIGKSTPNGKFLWSACINCGKERWVEKRAKRTIANYCQDCNGIQHRKSIPTIIPDSNYIPKSGDIIEAKYINFSGSKRHGCFKWRVCENCKEGKWIQANRQEKVCIHCRAKVFKKTGENSSHWKGGIVTDDRGYRLNLLNKKKDKQFWYMAVRNGEREGSRYVFEHRLVMAKHLGRCLEKWEIVHHINGIKDDNRIENLELLKEKKEHLPSMAMQCRIKELEERVTLLEAENVLLKSEKQLSAI